MKTIWRIEGKDGYGPIHNGCGLESIYDLPSPREDVGSLGHVWNSMSANQRKHWVFGFDGMGQFARMVRDACRRKAGAHGFMLVCYKVSEDHCVTSSAQAAFDRRKARKVTARSLN